MAEGVDDPEWREEYEDLLNDLRILGESTERLIELGQHIQMWGNETVDLVEARKAFERAVELEPDNPEAMRELAFYIDAIENKPDQALRCFQRAAEDAMDPEALWGLARCLAQLGRQGEALDLIGSSPLQDHPKVAEIRGEIIEGYWEPL